MALSAEQRALLKGAQTADVGNPGGESDYFKFALGDREDDLYILRLLESNPLMAKVKMHYVPGDGKYGTGATGVCPRDHGKDCLACDTSESLFFKVYEAHKKTPAWDSFRNLQAKGRVHFNILDFQSGEVKILNLTVDSKRKTDTADTPPRSGGSILINKAETLFKEKDIDVFDSTKGRNLEMRLVPIGQSGHRYAPSFANRNSKIPAVNKGWEKKIHDLDQVKDQKILTDQDVVESIDWLCDRYPQLIEILRNV